MVGAIGVNLRSRQKRWKWGETAHECGRTPLSRRPQRMPSGTRSSAPISWTMTGKICRQKRRERTDRV